MAAVTREMLLDNIGRRGSSRLDNLERVLRKRVKNRMTGGISRLH